MNCLKCGFELESDWKLCPNCGSEIKKVCLSCGNNLEADWMMCPFCGKNVDHKTGISLPVKDESFSSFTNDKHIALSVDNPLPPFVQVATYSPNTFPDEVHEEKSLVSYSSATSDTKEKKGHLTFFLVLIAVIVGCIFIAIWLDNRKVSQTDEAILVTTRHVIMREDASMYSNPIKNIDSNIRLKIEDSTSSSGEVWYKVRFENKAGWIPADSARLIKY
ncbi:MAG: zinc ribbon domain-containing protein [Bacteroidales bacterium]|nr:zinc ribbon domain-containing protein [Bacteroidales bacterium]